MNLIYYAIAAIVAGLTVFGVYTLEDKTLEQQIGAFGDAFLSRQVATSPQNGYILQTDGTNSSWVSAASVISGAANWQLTTNTFGQSALAPTTTQNILVSGTGTSTFSGGIEAWRQISAPYFQATSTSLTSVFPRFSATSGTTTNATSTNLAITSLTSALVQTNANGLTAEYAGTSCTNQFVRSLSALGIATCETVQNTDLANSSVSYGGVSVSLGGSDATPAFNLADATGLPISTGVSGLATGIATFLGTPSSANLATAVTDETGSGALVFANSPTLVTPALGTPSALVLTNATGLPLTTGVTGTLPVANGGTGATTLTGLLQGNGTSAVTAVTGTAGQFPYYNGTNTLAATSTLFLATNGNVGIGTTNPNYKLQVEGNGGYLGVGASSGYTRLYFGGSDVNIAGVINRVTGTETLYLGESSDTGAMRFRGSGATTFEGNVGIGTSTPFKKLSIAGDLALNDGSVTAIYDVSANTLNTTGATFQLNPTNGVDASFDNGTFYLDASTNRIGIGTTTPDATLDVLKAAGSDTAGTNLIQVLRASGNQAFGFRYSADSSKLILDRMYGGAWSGGVMSFDRSNGNVGIGTTSPAAVLEVNGDVRFAEGSKFNGFFYDATNGRLGLGSATPVTPLEVVGEARITNELYLGSSALATDPDYTWYVDQDTGFYNPSANQLGLVTGGTDRLRINSSGNVGIGTTTPPTTLSIDDASAKISFYDTNTNELRKFEGALEKSFTYATTTAWTATTTIPLGPAWAAQKWSGAKCFTDVGTLNVSLYDGTNRANLFNASTTVGTISLTTNNTFTASEKRYVDIGTPASSPTKISCTFRYYES